MVMYKNTLIGLVLYQCDVFSPVLNCYRKRQGGEKMRRLQCISTCGKQKNVQNRVISAVFKISGYLILSVYLDFSFDSCLELKKCELEMSVLNSLHKQCVFKKCLRLQQPNVAEILNILCLSFTDENTTENGKACFNY